MDERYPSLMALVFHPLVLRIKKRHFDKLVLSGDYEYDLDLCGSNRLASKGSRFGSGLSAAR